MTWIMHDKEFEAVLLLSSSQRYAYFIKRVADWEEIWSLKNEEGWVLAGDNQKNELVPVWPHERLALACAIGHWDRCQPSLIKLSTWLERWTPGMINDQRLVAVFMTPSDKGVVVSPQRLEKDLETELSRIE